MTGSDATVLSFDVPAERAPDTPTLDFTIRYGPGPEQVDTFTLYAPKLSIAVGLLSLMDEGGLANVNVTQAGVKVAEALWGVVAYVKEEPPEPMVIGPEDDPRPNPNGGRARGQARLLARLRDPRDGMDILDLAPLFERAIKAMFDRPTGPSLASLRKPGDGGTASEAGSSAPPASTVGT